MAVVGVQKSFSHVGFSGGSSPSQFNHVAFGSHDSYQSAAVAPPFGRKRMVLSTVMAGLVVLATSCFNPSKPAATQNEGETLTTLPYDNSRESILGKPGRYFIEFIKQPNGTLVAQANNAIGTAGVSFDLPLNTPTNPEALNAAFEAVVKVKVDP